MYFTNFKDIYYDFIINGKREIKVLKDITKNVRIRKEILANITIYDEYDIKDGETPEIIAEKIYGNANYHWIIMLVNERYDYLSEFPLAAYELEQFIIEKYNAITFIKDTIGQNTAFPLFGVTDIPSWSYVGSVVTISAPGQLGAYQLSVGDTVNLSNVVSTTNAPNGTYIISAVDGDTITFDSGNVITGTPSGFEFLKLSTTNREYYPHHYIDTNFFTVDEFTAGAVPVSNYEYEDTVNESKRRIKIISKDLIEVVLKNFSKL